MDAAFVLCVLRQKTRVYIKKKKIWTVDVLTIIVMAYFPPSQSLSLADSENCAWPETNKGLHGDPVGQRMSIISGLTENRC